MSEGRGGMCVNGTRVTVGETGKVGGGSPQGSRLDAAGGVTVRRPDQMARSQYAVYDLNRRIITMVGAVSLDQGGNRVSGARLTLNLDTGRAVIDGSGVAATGSGACAGATGRPSGRVNGHFPAPRRD